MKTVLATHDVYNGNGAANLNHGFIFTSNMLSNLS